MKFRFRKKYIRNMKKNIYLSKSLKIKNKFWIEKK